MAAPAPPPQSWTSHFEPLWWFSSPEEEVTTTTTVGREARALELFWAVVNGTDVAGEEEEEERGGIFDVRFGVGANATTPLHEAIRMGNTRASKKQFVVRVISISVGGNILIHLFLWILY